MEQTYTLNDVDVEQEADFYAEYESAYDEGNDEQATAASTSFRRWTIWHVLLLLVLLIFAAALVVYVVLPFITSLTPMPAASQLPTPVQA